MNTYTAPNHQNHYFTFTHDRFLDQAIQTKEDKSNPLVNAIRAQGWNIRPLIIITIGVRGGTHTRSIESLENLHIPTSIIIKKNEKHPPNSHQITIRKNSTINKNHYTSPHIVNGL